MQKVWPKFAHVLKVQGGLRIKNLKNWLSEMRLAAYVYAANEEN